MDGIPWDREVELFRAGPPGRGLEVTRDKMTLQAAIEAWIALPDEEKWTAGIGLHELLRMVIDGREALVGWYNADGCRMLASMIRATTQKPAVS